MVFRNLNLGLTWVCPKHFLKINEIVNTLIFFKINEYKSFLTETSDCCTAHRTKYFKPNQTLLLQEKSNWLFVTLSFDENWDLKMICFYRVSMELMMVRTETMMSRMEWTDVGWPRAFGFDAQRAGLQHLSFRAMWEKSKK